MMDKKQALIEALLPPLPERNPVGKFGGYGGVDFSRPILQNPDGSISTEETVTVPIDGTWYNLPSIVNGQRPPPGVSPEDYAVEMYRRGVNTPVGAFGTVEEAVKHAQDRTKALGQILAGKK